jgi:hypothetical protein
MLFEIFNKTSLNKIDGNEEYDCIVETISE